MPARTNAEPERFSSLTAELMAEASIRLFTPEQLAAMVDGDTYAETVEATGFDPGLPPKE